MTRIKICGITTLEDALACANADMLGFNFYQKSPRYIQPEAARVIANELRQRLGNNCPQLIALFVNANPNLMLDVVETAAMDAIQLSGDETPDMLADLNFPVYKAIRPRSQAEAETLASSYPMPEDINLPTLLVDAYHKELYGGTGEQASVDIARAVKCLAPRMMLAGGLTPENIAERVQAIQPWGVDVASGVETGQPGIKDHVKVRAFIDAIRLQKEQQP
jgi:phosphoribosylanthranilate isomerase